jgi:hypothetical protein
MGEKKDDGGKEKEQWKNKRVGEEGSGGRKRWYRGWFWKSKVMVGQWKEQKKTSTSMFGLV